MRHATGGRVAAVFSRYGPIRVRVRSCGLCGLSTTQKSGAQHTRCGAVVRLAARSGLGALVPTVPRVSANYSNASTYARLR
eukprot:3797817-Prymnesium_polylepis.2